MLCWWGISPANAQQTLTVTGFVLEQGTFNPVANHPVNIALDSINGFNYFNTVSTNASGQYTDVISVPANANVGQGNVWTFDCQQFFQGSSFTYTPNITMITDTFVICQTVGSCNALFSYSSNGNNFNFSDASSASGSQISSWNWSFGDGNSSSSQNPSHVYGAPGIFPVCLTIVTNNGCTSTYCDSVNVTGGSGNCQAFYVVQGSGSGQFFFQDASTGTTPGTGYFWDFGDGNFSGQQNPSHVYNASGVYTPCLTIFDSLNNCQDTYCDTLVVALTGPNCQASFVYQAGANGQVFFSSNSTGTNPTTQYSWSFGDGSGGSGSNPNHTYNAPGTYIACLTIFDSLGCQSTYCDSIVVNSTGQNCQANFIFQQGPGGQVFFQSTSTGTNFLTNYHWSFGDGTSGSGPNPNHVYANSGVYTVCLTIFDSTNCQSTYCDTVNISVSGCQANYNFQQAANGLVFFQDNSVGVSNSTYFFWDFGDGTVATGPNPQHTYTNGGVYLACLTISDSLNNCQDTYCDTILVNTGGGVSCQAAFGVSYNGNSVVFSDQSSASPGQVIAWFWDFGDGTTSNMQNPVKNYVQGGLYTVCLSIETSDSCFSTTCQQVQAAGGGGGCQAYFNYNVGGNGQVFFQDASSGTSAFGTSYFWDFGDGNIGFGPTPNHTYANNGLYLVCLTISDSSTNCQDTWCDSIFVNTNGGVNCQADFQWSYSGNTVVFNDQSTANPGFVNAWFWDFGDGTTSTLQNPSHNYAQGGLYNVCLTIQTSDSCVSTTCNQLQANGGGGNCQASFSIQPDTSGQFSWIITNTSSSNTPLFYFWDFGDGNTSTAQFPTHTYSTAGTYLVCLTVNDSLQNCVDTHCDTVSISNPGLPITVQSPVLSNSQPEFTSEVSLYPVPVNNQLNIRIDAVDGSEVSVDIVNLSGQVVLRQVPGYLPQGQSRVEVDVNQLADGMYFTRIQLGEETITRKFIVKH